MSVVQKGVGDRQKKTPGIQILQKGKLASLETNVFFVRVCTEHD